MFAGLYALVIGVSFAGMATIDHRWRLAAYADPRRTVLAVGASALLLLGWDLAAIGQGVFRLGDSPALLGWEVFAHMPVEEFGFIVFLPYCSLVVYRGADRLFARARSSARRKAS